MTYVDDSRHRDLRGRRLEPWIRRAGLLVLVAIVTLALLNRFGQQPSSTASAGPGASMRLSAPKTIRGGLMWQARLTIDARQALQHPRIVLDPGWLEQMQVNTIEPNPVQESSRHGPVVLSYDQLAAGDRLVVWLQFQANPTAFGRHRLGVELDDADQRVAALHPTLTVLP
jgi:hypothetical protein